MAILRNTGCNSPERIVENFHPFCEPDTIKGQIVGNDLDSLLSATLLKDIYGWDIVSIYDYEKIWFSSAISDFAHKMLTGNYVAVDLDIYHPCIPSVGHHILAMTKNDLIPGHAQSLNPNLIRGIYHTQFQRKYPLGTIHLLSWLFGRTGLLNEDTQALVWLADSSYINGQSHRFRENVGEWVNNFFNDDYFRKQFEEIDTVEFEKEIQMVTERISETGISVSRGQVASRHLRLRGGQCQWRNPATENIIINRMLDLIRDFTGWNRPVLPETFELIVGKRSSAQTTSLVTGGKLDSFLDEKGVFSYVMPNRGRINYTTGIP